MNNNRIGNLSTLFKMVSMTLSGWVLGYLISQGLDFGIDVASMSEILFMVLMFLASYIDARYPNTFEWLDNAPEIIVESEEDLINQDYYD